MDLQIRRRLWNRLFIIQGLLGDTTMRKEEERQLLESIEILLDQGAHWNPPNDHLRDVRRGLGTHDGKHVVSVIRLLLYTPGAADPTNIWEVCRTDKIRALIRANDSELWNELLEFRPCQRA